MIANSVRDGKRAQFPTAEEALLGVKCRGESMAAAAAAQELASRLRLKALIRRAWSATPEARPLAAEIAEEIEAMRREFLTPARVQAPPG